MISVFIIYAKRFYRDIRILIQAMFRKLSILLWVLFVLPLAGLRAQLNTEQKKLLIGSWAEYPGPGRESSCKSGNPAMVILSFYSDKHYQFETRLITSTGINCFHDLQMTARWKCNYKTGIVTLGKLKFDGPDGHFAKMRIKGEPLVFQILTVTADSLLIKVLESHNTNQTGYIMRLKRAPLREIKTWETDAYPEDLLLVNVSDSGKKLVLKPGSSIITMGVLNDSLADYIHTVQGKFEKASADSVFMNVDYEEIRFTAAGGTEKGTDLERSGKEPMIKGFAIKNIHYINTDKIKHPAAYAIGTCAVVISILGTVIVSPVEGFHSPGGSFDAMRFLAFTGGSLLGGLLLGPPLIIYGQDNKSYFLHTRPEDKKVNALWRIKPFVYE
jgi:hypothetical protein